MDKQIYNAELQGNVWNKKIEFRIEYYRLTDPLLKRSHFEPVYVIKSLAKYWGTHLREKVQHHKVIKDRAFWPFGDPISICPGCTTTVPAREVVPVYMVVKKMQKITRGLLKFENRYSKGNAGAKQCMLPYSEKHIFWSQLIKLKDVVGGKPQVVSFSEETKKAAVQRWYT